MSDKNVYKMTVVCCNYAVASYLWSVTTVMTMLYGHFGPKTLRHLYLVPKCPGHFGTGAEVSEDTSAPVPKCLKTLRKGAAGQQQANRTQTCPWGPTYSGPCPAALPHYTSCAAFVGRRHKRYYCRWSSRWCCRAWTVATRRSPATRSTD